MLSYRSYIMIKFWEAELRWARQVMDLKFKLPIKEKPKKPFQIPI
jgi:hypothetical protein